MTTSNQHTHATLQQQIETFQNQLAEQLPAEVLAELSKTLPRWFKQESPNRA